MSPKTFFKVKSLFYYLFLFKWRTWVVTWAV